MKAVLILGGLLVSGYIFSENVKANGFLKSKEKKVVSNPRDTYGVTKSGLVKTESGAKYVSAKPDLKTEFATFAAGCFWGVEQEFRKLDGVIATSVGYSGGKTKNPTYEEVCTDKTGHAEVVKVEFDPTKISYEKLLDLFWDIHDPTTLNRQGPDVGSQYRSAVFYHSDSQKALAVKTQNKLQDSGELTSKIVTQVVPAAEFFAAEEYHQQYVEKGGRAVCHFRRKGK